LNIGKLPRVMRLMALAIKFDGVIRAGVIRDYAGSSAARRRYQGKDDPDHEPAEPCAGHPEEILFLPRTAAGRDPVSDRRLRHLAAVGPMGPAAETPTGGL